MKGHFSKLVLLSLLFFNCLSCDNKGALLKVNIEPGYNQCLNVGDTRLYKSIAHYEDGSEEDVTELAEWTTSLARVAAFSSKGTLQMMALGTTLITATFNSVSGSVQVFVGSEEYSCDFEDLVSITITPANQSILALEGISFTATGDFQYETRDVTMFALWGSSNESVASFTGGADISALNAGCLEVTATIDSLTGATTLIVSSVHNESGLTAVDVTPVNPFLDFSDTTTFSLTGTFTDLATIDLTGSALWESSVPEIATISTDGSASSLTTEGSTLVRAYCGTFTDFTTLEVSDCQAYIPNTVRADSNDTSSIDITWNQDYDTDYYNIYWSKTPGVTKLTGTKIPLVNPPYKHLGLTEGDNYYYVVTSADGVCGKESDESDEAYATVGDPCTLPAQPVGVSAEINGGSIDIRWTDVYEIDYYNIYWSQKSPVTKETGTKITHIPRSQPYNHSGLTLEIRYYYVMTAENSCGESVISSEVCGRPGFPDC